MPLCHRSTFLSLEKLVEFLKSYYFTWRGRRRVLKIEAQQWTQRGEMIDSVEDKSQQKTNSNPSRTLVESIMTYEIKRE